MHFLSYNIIDNIQAQSCTLSFIRSIESFAAPIFLGPPSGIYVLSTKIYDYLSDEPANYSAGTAMAVMLLVITIILVLIQTRVLGKKQYVTVTGKGYRPRVMDLGPLRWPIFAVSALLLAILLVAPFVILIQNTFMHMAGMYGPGMYTFNNYIEVFNRADVWDAVKNTIILGVVGATAGIFLCTLISYVSVKTNFRERKPLDIITWIPWAFPGVVLGVALLWAYILLPLPFGLVLYGTMALLIIAVITKQLPVGSRVMSSAMIQISSELEESALVHGATWSRTLLRIWAPLLKHGFISGWILLFTFAVRDLPIVVMLYSPSSIIYVFQDSI